MITASDYERLKPYREEIMNYKKTQKAKGECLVVLDKIRQEKRLGAICFSCLGSKVNAMNDAVIWIEEYERENDRK